MAARHGATTRGACGRPTGTDRRHRRSVARAPVGLVALVALLAACSDDARESTAAAPDTPLADTAGGDAPGDDGAVGGASTTWQTARVRTTAAPRPTS